ncbi:hypothetical protein [Caenispirillum bisanense]|uniref:hypothetical protein n=1 Tax=Caenispirillum bisanense TaxID=414052 RepID=UPI0031CE119E
MYRFATPLAVLALIGMTAGPALAAEQPVPDRKPTKGTITLVNRAEAPECAFTGKRVVSLLSRDDVVAATEFRQFYQAFDCPGLHLAAAFGCAVDVPEDVEEPVNDRIERCWEQPSSRPLPTVAAPAEAAPAADAPAADAAGKPPAEAAKPAAEAAKPAAKPEAKTDGKPAAGAAGTAPAPAKTQ